MRISPPASMRRATQGRAPVPSLTIHLEQETVVRTQSMVRTQSVVRTHSVAVLHTFGNVVLTHLLYWAPLCTADVMLALLSELSMLSNLSMLTIPSKLYMISEQGLMR